MNENMMLSSKILEEIFNSDNRAITSLYAKLCYLFNFIMIRVLVDFFKLDRELIESKIQLLYSGSIGDELNYLLIVEVKKVSGVEEILSKIEKVFNVELVKTEDYFGYDKYYNRYYIKLLDREKFNKDMKKYYTYFKLLYKDIGRFLYRDIERFLF